MDIIVGITIVALIGDIILSRIQRHVHDEIIKTQNEMIEKLKSQISNTD